MDFTTKGATRRSNYYGIATPSINAKVQSRNFTSAILCKPYNSNLGLKTGRPDNRYQMRVQENLKRNNSQTRLSNLSFLNCTQLIIAQHKSKPRLNSQSVCDFTNTLLHERGTRRTRSIMLLAEDNFVTFS